MTNTCSNMRRKCKGLRRGPPFGLWMWCIVLKCLNSLPCIVSRCQGVDLSVALYPEGMINLPYGEPLELFCVAKEGTADNLEFELSGITQPSDRINSTTRRLYIKNLNKQVYTYYCRNNATDKICTSRVLVDSSPSNVTDFGCISKNLEEMNCSWTSPEIFVITNYSLSFSINGVPVDPCFARKNGKRRSCAWNSYSQPRYKQMETSYYFHLKACNCFGCNQQNFTVDHFSIVKPDAPENLRVIRTNSHSVELNWSIPNNIVDFLACGIVHKIEYQIARIDNTTQFHSVNTSSLSLHNRTYKFWLENLPFAHMQYEVRIYIKSVLATEKKFWSDFTYAVFYTLSERPRRPPDTIAGAFYQALYDNKRVIYVYWKQLEEYEQAGANFTYKVVITQGLKNPQTYYPDKNKSLSYIVLDNASLEAMNITIWSYNANGSSDNSSHLFIPARQDTDELKVEKFTKLAYENGTYKLSWVGIKNIDNYTLFWCHHNATQICASKMDFMVMDPRKDSHVIHLPTDSRYQFAISANNGSKTSGMIWAICDISKDLIPMIGFPVKLDHDAARKSSVKLTWTMSCTFQEGIITGYSLSYCPVLDTSTLCDSSLGNWSTYNISDPKVMEVNITDLKPYRTYLFKLSLNTTYGLKTIENASTDVTTTEDTPTSPINVTISEIESESLVVSWSPPLQKNGKLGKYVILNYGEDFYDIILEKDDNNRRAVNLTGLHGFTNYSLSVKACNTAISSCSNSSPQGGLFIRTKIGPPGKLKKPTFEGKNPELLKWDLPDRPGGTIDSYQVKRIRDQNTPEIYNTSDMSFSVMLCEGVAEEESYYVRAVNVDEDSYYGTLADKVEVVRPFRKSNNVLVYPGEWSSPKTVYCKSKDSITMTLSLLAVFALIGMMYCGLKLYKKYRKMEDIKPVLPSGLGIPEKDLTKYAFGGWNPTNKDDKPSSDEMLLLPNSRTTVSTPENKQINDNNCGSSDHTDSTALSDTSRGAVERQTSTSDDGSDSSLHLEVEPVRPDDNDGTPEEESSNSASECSPGNSPYLNDKGVKKSSTSGYVQTVASPPTGYVQSAPMPQQSPFPKLVSQPASSSYVMAALSPPIFTTGVAPPSLPSQPPASSGYIRPEDAQAKSIMNSKLGLPSAKVFGPESLPPMPTLPQSVKHGADSSYIQLQSLDALPSHKQPVRNAVPLKPQASSGYVSPGDAVINKHLNNMLSGGHLAEESAILDPAMSPDAYCRFSWSTDPANDNLHSLLADSNTLNSTKN